MPVFRKYLPRHIRVVWRAMDERSRNLDSDKREGQHPSADKHSIQKFGRPFVFGFHPTRRLEKKIEIDMDESTHESPISMLMRCTIGRRKVIIGKIKLGFSEKTLVIETIQGAGTLNEVRHTNNMLNESWATYLLRVAEQNAKKSGYQQVFIRDPSTMYWYQHPITGHEKGSARDDIKANEIQQRMKESYHRFAMRRGFKKVEGGYAKIL